MAKIIFYQPAFFIRVLFSFRLAYLNRFQFNEKPIPKIAAIVSCSPNTRRSLADQTEGDLTLSTIASVLR